MCREGWGMEDGTGPPPQKKNHFCSSNDKSRKTQIVTRSLETLIIARQNTDVPVLFGNSLETA